MSLGPQTKWPAMTDEAFPGPFVTVPQQPTQTKPGQLTAEQIKTFFEDGFLIIDKFFTDEELAPIRDDINELVDQLANALYKHGKIKDVHADKGYMDRLIALEKEYPGANIVLHQYGYLPESVRKLWTNERILNMMEQLLGTQEIKGHPVWNLRTKTPNNTATTVPWHQDVAYLDQDSYKVLQVTGWIPLIDTDEETGCCQMVCGGHRTGRIANHTGCWKDTWYVILEEEEMQRKLNVNLDTDVVTCPVPFGGLLLFSNMIPHRSLNNRKLGVTRWSLDLRWQRNELPVGFHGLKQGVQFRSADQNFKLDLESLNKLSHRAGVNGLQGADDLDTTVRGPWMTRWETTNENRHTLAMKADMEAGIDCTWHKDV